MGRWTEREKPSDVTFSGDVDGFVERILAAVRERPMAVLGQDRDDAKYAVLCWLDVEPCGPDYKGGPQWSQEQEAYGQRVVDAVTAAIRKRLLDEASLS